MASQDLYIKGKLKWAKTKTPDKFGNYKVTVYLDQESLEVMRDLQSKGLKNVMQKDEDGYNMTFRRPVEKVMRGVMVGMGPVVVKNPDGTLLEDVYIGNGTDGTVKLSIYGYNVPGTGKKGIAARLEAIRVDNLVPYTIAKDFSEDEKKQQSGLDEQPAPLF